jgi:hypothetical protein
VRKRVFGYNVLMEFFLTDPNIKRRPPANTRLLDLWAKPYPDGKRLRVALDLTPFQLKPILERTLTDSAREVVAEASIVEPPLCKLEFTLHFPNRSGNEGGVYNLRVNLSFPDLGENDHRDLFIEIPSPTV